MYTRCFRERGPAVRCERHNGIGSVARGKLDHVQVCCARGRCSGTRSVSRFQCSATGDRWVLNHFLSARVIDSCKGVPSDARRDASSILTLSARGGGETRVSLFAQRSDWQEQQRKQGGAGGPEASRSASARSQSISGYATGNQRQSFSDAGIEVVAIKRIHQQLSRTKPLTRPENRAPS